MLCTADFRLHCSAGIAELAGKFGVGTPTLQHIIDGLKQPTDHDIRVSKYTTWQNLCSHVAFNKHQIVKKYVAWYSCGIACTKPTAWLWQDRDDPSTYCFFNARRLFINRVPNYWRIFCGINAFHVWLYVPDLRLRTCTSFVSVLCAIVLLC